MAYLSMVCPMWGAESDKFKNACEKAEVTIASCLQKLKAKITVEEVNPIMEVLIASKILEPHKTKLVDMLSSRTTMGEAAEVGDGASDAGQHTTVSDKAALLVGELFLKKTDWGNYNLVCF